MIDKIRLRAKRFFLRTSGKVSHLKKSVKCNSVWYGGPHTGFYVQPDLLNAKSIVYSFGIGEDISFDLELIKNHDLKVFAFDPTPKSLNWLKNQNLPPNFNYFNYGISNKTGFVEFYLPKNPNYVSGSLLVQSNVSAKRKVKVRMKNIKDIKNELLHDHIDVLKIDIEGSEYDIIEDILTSGISISQILIEFHDRFFENGALKSRQAVNKLGKHGYKIFAVSANYEEVSFIHRTLL